MQKIEVTYNLFPWWKIKFTRQQPQSWQEINARQLIAISYRYVNLKSDAWFIAKFLSLPHFLVKRMPLFYVYSLIQEITFINDYTPRDTFVIPQIANGIAPLPKLGQMPFGRFMFIDTYFNDFASNSNNIEALDKFVACLYWPGDVAFNENLIALRAKSIARINPIVKQAIAINYRLVKDWLTDKYPLVFSKKQETDEPARKSNSSWIAVFDTIVDDDIINSDKYALKTIHEVLRYITRKIKQNAKRS